MQCPRIVRHNCNQAILLCPTVSTKQTLRLFHLLALVSAVTDLQLHTHQVIFLDLIEFSHQLSLAKEALHVSFSGQHLKKSYQLLKDDLVRNEQASKDAPSHYYDH